MITHTTEWKSEEDTPPRPWFRFYDGGHKASEDDMEPFSAGQPESNREFSEKETFEEIGALEGRETEKAEATEEETEEEPVEWDGSEAQLVLEDDAAEYESSSLLMMTPIGGCGFLLMGLIADRTHFTLPFLVPLIGFVIVLAYAAGEYNLANK